MPYLPSKQLRSYPPVDDEAMKVQREQALKHCQRQIDFYEKAKRKSRLSFQISQTLAVTLSGLTPILILWTELPKPIQALPAAVAAIMVGLNGTFQFRENWTRFALGGQALRTEKIKFKTKTSRAYSVDDSHALENFVSRINEITANEISDWYDLVSGQSRTH